MCKSTAQYCVQQIVHNFIPSYGSPNTIVSDHGRQFLSKIWQETLGNKEIEVSMTSVYHPQSNPVECFMRELVRLFQKFCTAMQIESNISHISSGPRIILGIKPHNIPLMS